jgi:pimeloyl-ACP methyl ester carboxylesterase
LGVARLIGASLAGAPAMPSYIRTEMALLNSGQRSTETTIAEAQERATSDAQLQAAPSLGDRPLIVLASEQNMTQDPSWPEAQRLQAALSSNGHLTTVAGSGHYIHWEQPSVVIDAVEQVIGQTRSSATR